MEYIVGTKIELNTTSNILLYADDQIVIQEAEEIYKVQYIDISKMPQFNYIY